MKINIESAHTLTNHNNKRTKAHQFKWLCIAEYFQLKTQIKSLPNTDTTIQMDGNFKKSRQQSKKKERKLLNHSPLEKLFGMFQRITTIKRNNSNNKNQTTLIINVDIYIFYRLNRLNEITKSVHSKAHEGNRNEGSEGEHKQNRTSNNIHLKFIHFINLKSY